MFKIGVRLLLPPTAGLLAVPLSRPVTAAVLPQGSSVAGMTIGGVAGGVSAMGVVVPSCRKPAIGHDRRTRAFGRCGPVLEREKTGPASGSVQGACR